MIRRLAPVLVASFAFPLGACAAPTEGSDAFEARVHGGELTAQSLSTSTVSTTTTVTQPSYAFVTLGCTPLAPSITGPIGGALDTNDGYWYGKPVGGLAPLGYQTTNCAGRYEIEADVASAFPQQSILDVSMGIDPIAAYAITEAQCPSIRESYAVYGLANGVWTTLESGTLQGWWGNAAGPLDPANPPSCNVERTTDASPPIGTAETFAMPGDKAAAYSAFRVSASAYYYVNGTKQVLRPALGIGMLFSYFGGY